MNPDTNSIVQALKVLKERSKPVGPNGLPSPATNEDSEAMAEGKYCQESLTDPGWIGGVTGTGRGRQISVRR